MPNTRGRLITFEGIECAGKGTQIALAVEYLERHHINIMKYHEPGGTAISEGLRALIKFPEKALQAIFNAFSGHSDFPNIELSAEKINAQTLKIKPTPACQLFLFEAARSDLTQVICQLIDSGVNIVCDRFTDSTIAYQGYGHGLILEDVKLMNKIALNGLWPDLTLFLDIPVPEMFNRVGKQDAQKNAFFEKHYGPEFFERVRQGYHEIAKTESSRFIIIDGTQPAEKVFGEVRPYLDLLFGINMLKGDTECPI